MGVRRETTIPWRFECHRIAQTEEAFTFGFEKLAPLWICLVCFRNKLDRSDFLSQFKKPYLKTVQVQLG